MIPRLAVNFLVLFAMGALSSHISAATVDEELTTARGLLRRGKYAEAAEIYTQHVSDSPAALIGVARCQSARGHRDEAIEKLAASTDPHADVSAELARMYFDRGDYDDADRHVESALSENPDQVLARWIRGELFRVQGKLDEAEDTYRWLIRFYNAHDEFDAESLRWIGLGASRYAHWNRLNDQYHFLVSDLYPDAVQLEGDFWPAHYEAGLLYLEKFNRKDAAEQFDAALAINPNSAEVHAVSAVISLLNRKIEAAQASIDRALEINPGLLDAWLLRAELAWGNFNPPEAVRILTEHALPLNPVSEETRGRLAACYVLEEGLTKANTPSRTSRLEAEVLALNPHAGTFYLAAADWLQDRHQRPEAERFFLEAIRRMPRQMGAKAGLGMLWMAEGREPEARKILKETFKDDPFNVRVHNSLDVLDVLDEMTALPTKHCLLKYDGENDKLLARFAAAYIDEAYVELSERFGYRPPKQPAIEIFHQAKGQSGHRWFSTRMTGLPYVGTVAASTGNIVAMVSPQDPSSGEKYPWARVLRHELVHVITLQQTGFHCPHWYTEGLAQWCENTPRPRAMRELLARRIREQNLFDLNTINFGFTRPDSSDEWTLAYAQAEAYVQYMLEDHEPEVLREMLHAYAERLTTPEAIQLVLGVSVNEFEQGYLDYLKKSVKEIRLPDPLESLELADLLAAQRKSPDNANLAARLALAYFQRNAIAEAGPLALRAIKIEPTHQQAAYVLARIALKNGQTDNAILRLEKSLHPDTPDLKTLNLLAALKLKAKKYAEAAELYSLGARTDPTNPRWLRALGLVYSRSEDHENLSKTLAQLTQLVPDSLVVKKELAKLSLENEDYDAATDWANQALEVDVQDADVHRMLAESLAGNHHYEKAIDAFLIAIELNPTDPQRRFALADAYIELKKTDDARRVLEELLRVVPDYAPAELLLESLEETDSP